MTRLTFRGVLLAGFVFSGLAVASAQGYRPGDQVVVIADAKLTVEGRGEVDKVWPGLVLKVGAVNGDWLWLSNGKPGWLDKKHVIPLDRAAIDRLTAMIRAKPREARLYSGRALVWWGLGELDIALADLNEAIRLDPSGASYGIRGLVWRAKGDYDKAIADYNESIRLDPSSADYNNRGSAWSVKGDRDKAIADYNEALRLDPKYTLVYINRGAAWSVKGDYDKAIADYNQALRLDPKDARAQFKKGVAHFLQRRSTAVAELQAVIDQQGWSGEMAPYAVILGTLAAKLDQDAPRAQKFLDDSRDKLRPDWPEPIVRFLRGELDDKALLALATDNDKATEAHCYLGLEHLARGNLDQAREHFTWVAEKGRRSFDEYAISVAELKRLAQP